MPQPVELTTTWVKALLVLTSPHFQSRIRRERAAGWENADCHRSVRRPSALEHFTSVGCEFDPVFPHRWYRARPLSSAVGIGINFRCRKFSDSDQRHRWIDLKIEWLHTHLLRGGNKTESIAYAVGPGRPARAGRHGRGLPCRQGPARPALDPRRSRR